MYRQILVDPRDTNYQRILWKSSLSEPLLDYQLLTVTYGMACAPFLALRVLKQLVIDEGQQFPLAVPILSNNIYVDDLLFGADDAIQIRQAHD
ncbi:Gag-pol polyprotein [Camponotus japonicus]